MTNPISDILNRALFLPQPDQVVLDRELTWLYGVARDADQVFMRSGSVVLDPAGGVIVTNPETGDPTVILQSDGDSFFGSNLDLPANTALAVLANNNTYNNEALGEGDLLIGDNSSGKANMLWDVSAGQLKFRGGTTTNTYIDVDGTINATNGVFSGTITATSGTIGGWTIQDTQLFSEGVLLDGTNAIITLAGQPTNFLVDANGDFLTDADGNLLVDSDSVGTSDAIVLDGTVPSISVASDDVLLDATGITIATSTVGGEQTKQLKFWYNKPSGSPMGTLETYYSAASEHLFTIASYEVNSRDTDIAIAPKGNLKLDGYFSGGSDLLVRDFDVTEFQDGNVEIHQQLHLGSLGDTYLYRQGVAEWRTNSSVVIDGSVSGSLLFSSIEDGVTGGYKAGASSDVHLYRSAANTWRTSDSLIVDLGFMVGTTTAPGTGYVGMSGTVNASESAGCVVYNNADISHATSGAWQTLTFNSEERDQHGWHSTVSNTGRITPTMPGMYLFHGTVAFATDTTGLRQLRLLKNGSLIVNIIRSEGLASAHTAIEVTRLIYMNGTTDYMELSAHQTSGGALDMKYADAYTPYFSAMRIV
jgi:hypothetical protein